MPLPLRWRWKLERWRDAVLKLFRSEPKPARPRLCPACGTLVGATAGRCHECGASLTYSLAAASRSLSRLMPSTAPVTYGILTLCCLLYGVSLLLTLRASGTLAPPSGGLFGIFNLGAIGGRVLIALGASGPLPYVLQEPWRLVMAVFLHGSLLHIGFNMWVLMDVGPMVEEVYGSARYLFLFLVTGIFGYLVSATWSFLTGFHISIGASGALLGIIGLLLAITTRRGGIGAQMLRSQLIKWLIYIAVLGFLIPGIDNAAHAGGFAAGFVLGKLVADREPQTATERKRAYALGWASALVIAVSFGFMLAQYLKGA